MDFSAALFVGGRSSRMGRDKAFLEIDGVLLWRRQLQTLRELEPSEIFLAGPTQREWIESGLETVVDAKTDAGPLGGLVAVLRRCNHAHLLVLAVDLPNMTSAFLAQLLAMCSNNGGVVPRRNERFEPLAAIYPARCLALAESCLNAGEYSMQQLALRAANAGLITTRQIADSEDSLFFNLNTPADLAAITRK
jgi:molybdopterin-guanine dinucleotide biosynthesis protein A